MQLSGETGSTRMVQPPQFTHNPFSSHLFPSWGSTGPVAYVCELENSNQKLLEKELVEKSMQVHRASRKQAACVYVGMWILHHRAVAKDTFGRSHWSRQDGQATETWLPSSPTEILGWPHILTLLLLFWVEDGYSSRWGSLILCTGKGVQGKAIFSLRGRGLGKEVLSFLMWQFSSKPHAPFSPYSMAVKYESPWCPR